VVDVCSGDVVSGGGDDGVDWRMMVGTIAAAAMAAWGREGAIARGGAQMREAATTAV
jgi:hypothetical protein